MVMTYIRLEEKLRRQDAPAIGRGLIALEALALFLSLLFADLSRDWDLPMWQAVGIPIVLLGIALYTRRSRFWGRALICVGGFPLLIFLGWLSPLLLLIGVVIFFLAACVALVA